MQGLNLKIPESTFKNRLQKIADKMAAEDLKALVVFGNGSALGFASNTHGYMTYLCGWDSRNLGSIFVFSPQKDPVLLVPNRSLYLLAKESLWFDDIRSVPYKNYHQEVISVLKPLLSKGNRVGYIGKSETPYEMFEGLLSGLPDMDLIQANHLIDEERTIKEELQIEFHRRAAEICDEMFKTLASEIRKRKETYRLQADMELTARYAGCEYASTFLSIAPVVDRPRYAVDECLRIPQEGDQVLASVFALYRGHWGHAIRTGALGRPSEIQQQAFNATLEVEEKALQLLRPGMDLNEVPKASDDILQKRFPEIKTMDIYKLKTGHSLGLDYSDPILSEVFPPPSGTLAGQVNEKEKDKVIIKPGMLFEIHPNLFLPSKAIGAIGDMVLITEDGNEVLTKFTRELIAW